MGNVFQTITFDEQTRVLKHLDKAREIIRNSRGNYSKRAELESAITNVFHDVQIANTKEL